MKQKPSLKGMCAYQNANGYCCNDEDKNAHSGEKCTGCEHYEAQPVITPEVLPPATNALTHSRTHELATTSHSPGEVVAQYRLAVAGTLEMLRFGAMLVEVDSDLTLRNGKARHNPDGSGESLEKWLADNCPSINYKTAMRFKRLAEGLKREFKIPAKMRLTDALPEADGSVNGTIWSGVAEASRERVIEVRAEIWEFVNGKSARQLMFDFGLTAERKPTGGSREGSGRPTLANVDAKTRAGAAWAKIGHEIDLAVMWKFTRFLPPGIIKEALETVTLLRDLLKERLEEVKTGGSHVK